jgi:hypothetical protein
MVRRLPATPQGHPSVLIHSSGFENINFFNGNLNFTLPLLKIHGRGESGHAIVLKRENKWTMFHGPSYSYAHSNGWQNMQAGYGAGSLEGRMVGVDPSGSLNELRAIFSTQRFQVRHKLHRPAFAKSELTPARYR